jgi:hypothetical protein
MTTEYCFLLLPVEPLFGKLRATIQQLAERHDAPAFDPHVTLYSGPSNDEEAQSIAEEITNTFSRMELAPLKLDCTRAYTKTLFIQFIESSAARQIFNFIKKHSADPSAYVLNSHLSLLYKTMDFATQNELCRTIEMQKELYLFDQLLVIETEVPVIARQQIDGWRTIYNGRLKNPS